MEQLDFSLIDDSNASCISGPGAIEKPSRLTASSYSNPLSNSSHKNPLQARHKALSNTAKETGSVTSVAVSDSSAIQPYHLLPMLARCSHKSRWLMWLSPYRPMNKQWLATQGLQDSPIVHIDLCSETQMYLCERILESGNSHMIIEWQGIISSQQKNRIRNLAEKSGTHVVLISREQN